MFSFCSKHYYLADLLDGYYDIHCHLLPGVDDGAATPEKSRDLQLRMQSMGMRGMYLTPHLIHGAYDSRTEADLRREFAAFRPEAGLDVRLAAEYFVDDKFAERMAGEPLTMAGRHVLAEFSISGYSVHAFDILFEAALAGYEIILAHPERYAFVQNDGGSKVMNLFKQYKLQLNLLSLCGFHGGNARRCAESLLRQGVYTFVGTDTHNSGYLDALQRGSVSRKVFEAVRPLVANNRLLFE